MSSSTTKTSGLRFTHLFSILILALAIQTSGYSQKTIRFFIDGGKKATNHADGKVTLKSVLIGTSAAQMMISDNSEFTDAKWVTYTPSVPWTLKQPEGKKTIYIKFKDRAGNSSTPYKANIVWDKTPPENGKIEIKGGAESTKIPVVKLTLSANGASQMSISNRSNFPGAKWEPFKAERPGWRLEGADGDKRVYAKFKDGAGNVSSPVSAVIKYDKTPPKGTVKINTGEQWTNNPEITVYVTSNDASEMIVDGVPDPKFEPFSETKKITLQGEDGPKVIHVKLKDKAGNLGQTMTAKINLKRSAPTGAKLLVANGAKFCNAADKKVALKMMAQGATDMMVSNKSSFEGAKWVKYAMTMPIWVLDGTEDGEKTVYIKFKDQAGNETEPVSDNIILDRKAPKPVSVTINDGAAGTNKLDVKIKVKAEDEPYGMELSAVSTFAGAKWKKYTEEEIPWHLNGPDGNNYVYVKFKDKAGNTSSVIKGLIKVDRAPPTAPFIKINNGDPYTKEAAVNLAIKAAGATEMKISNTPDFSGAEWEPYAVTKSWLLSAEDGKKSVGIRFRDEAGNVSAVAHDEIILSTKAPEDPKVQVDGGAKYVKSPQRRVNLRLAAKGASKMMISNTKDFAGAKWEPAKGAKPWVIPAGDGEKIVYAKFMSASGIESAVAEDTIILDLTPPILGKIQLEGGARGTNSKDGSVKLEISGEDAKEMFVTDKNDFTNIVWEPFATTKDWSLTGEDGLKIIYCKLRDDAGNVTDPFKTKIVLDRTPPQDIKVSVKGGSNSVTTKQITLLINASGASHMMLSTDMNFEGAKWEDYDIMKKIHLHQEGMTWYFYKFKDHSENITEPGKIKIQVDTKPPTHCSIKIQNGNHYINTKTTPVRLNLSAKGATFMMISNSETFVNGKWMPYDTIKTPYSLIAGDGKKVVYAKFKDDAGNESHIVEAHITQDNTPPKLTKFQINKNKEFSNNKTVHLDINATGATHMMFSNEPDFAGSEWEHYHHHKSWDLSDGDGMKTVYVKLKDEAENTVQGQDKITLDTEF